MTVVFSGPSNPPPYDDKDAPPKYSAVCELNDHPVPYNGSYYPRPNAGHSSCAETTPHVFVKKQYDVIGQQCHVIGKHGHVVCKQVPATGQQSNVSGQSSHAIGQRNHVVDQVICQNGQRMLSRPSFESERTPEDAWGRPIGYQRSTLLDHTPLGVRGGNSQNPTRPQLRDGDLQTPNCEAFP